MDKQPIALTLPWFKLALVGVFLLSLALRFWRLGHFNTLVFDEVYYPVFANRYLIGEPVYNAHPPLSQLILAVSMWVGSHFPVGEEFVNGLTGSLRTTISYRWLNAVTGSFIPVVVGGIAYKLTQKCSYGAIAALLIALDGLFLVESRYGLNNVYLVLFGLLGHWYFLLALEHSLGKTSSSEGRPRRFRSYPNSRFRYLRMISDRVSDLMSNPPPRTRWQKFTVSGLFLGLSASIKWNGLGFLLGLILLWIVVLCLSWSLKHKGRSISLLRLHPLPLHKIPYLNPFLVFGYLSIMIGLTYYLTWIPHLILNPTPGFLEMQEKIFLFHQRVGSGVDVHPYCSPWYSWIIMWRPVAYFYQTSRNTEEMLPAYPPLPKGSGTVVYDVHAMGNPILWWLAAIAIFLFLVVLLQRCFSGRLGQTPMTPSTGLGLYLLCNYGANLLPWMKVSRCVFLYHYMAALVFAILALAWILYRCLNSPYYFYRQASLGIILLITVAFIFWLPIYIGLPLTPQGHDLRMWFPNWI